MDTRETDARKDKFKHMKIASEKIVIYFSKQNGFTVYKYNIYENLYKDSHVLLNL